MDNKYPTFKETLHFIAAKNAILDFIQWHLHDLGYFTDEMIESQMTGYRKGFNKYVTRFSPLHKAQSEKRTYQASNNIRR